MYKLQLALIPAVALGIVAAGCGGSGGEQAQAPAPPSQAANVWAQGNLRVETQGIGDLKTVVFSSPVGWGFGGLGFYGTAITRFEYRPLPGRIAFCRMVSGFYQIFVADPDGGREKQITNKPLSCSCPRFSPDGTKIVYYTTDGRVYVVNVDGSGDHLVQTFTTWSNYTPCWLLDGTVLFSGWNGTRRDIYRASPYGSGLQQLTNTSEHEYGPDCSRDGSWIAYYRPDATDAEIWVMRSDGSEQRQLTDNSANDYFPRWSPDGSSIVFWSDRDGNYELYKMEPDGSNQIRLTNDTLSDRDPVWSPDGSRIMWLKAGNLWEMNADGTNQHEVKSGFGGMYLDWWCPTSDMYRAFIGPVGSDYHGNNPPFGSSRNSVIVTTGWKGLGTCVTVGTDAGYPTIAYLGGAVFPTGSASMPAILVEVRAQAGTPGVNRVLEDRGPGVPIGLYDMPDDDPGSGKAYPQAVLLAFSPESGKLTAVMALRVASAGAAQVASGAPRLEERAGQLIVRAPICAVFTPDNPSRNLAPAGASAVVLCSRTGKLIGTI